jgi:sugar phosphate permease
MQAIRKPKVLDNRSQSHDNPNASIAIINEIAKTQIAIMSRRWIIFILATAHFFLSQFYRTSNAVIAPELIRDLSLNTEELGLLSASFFYGFALTQIPISVLLDKVGPRLMMTVLSLMGVVGAILFSIADSLGLGLIGRVLLGIGMACNLMGTFKLLTEWFEPFIFATLSGLVVSIGTFGNMVSATPLVMIVEQMGWRHSFQLIAAINLILTLTLFMVVRDRPARSTIPPANGAPSISLRQAFSNLALLFKKKDYWIISWATFVRYGTFAAFQALWAGPFLIEVMGYSAIRTGNLILLMNVGLIIGGPLWGALSDRVFKSRKGLIVFCLLVMALISFVLVTISAETGLLTISLIFFTFGLVSSGGMLMYPHIKDLMPHEMSGAAMTGINFFNMLGPAIFLQGLGILMQHLYPDASRGPAAFDASFVLCLICLVSVMILYFFTREKE